MTRSTTDSQPFRLPVISYALAVSAAVASAICYRYSQIGYTVASPLAMLFAVWSAMQLIRGLNNQSKINTYRWSREAIKASAKQQHKGRFATEEDLKEAGLMDEK